MYRHQNLNFSLQPFITPQVRKWIGCTAVCCSTTIKNHQKDKEDEQKKLIKIKNVVDSVFDGDCS